MIECSCRLWPIPGMYVVTSALFVNRARATLRNAELGFFGVWVYTRTHTPRFSGHPSNAGDFVFTRIFSRPLRTSCENVGTLSPYSQELVRKKFVPKKSASGRPSANLHARQISPRRIRRVNDTEKAPHPKELPGTPRKRVTPRSELHLLPICGEAHTALRGWRPISAALPYPVPSLFVPGH